MNIFTEQTMGTNEDIDAPLGGVLNGFPVFRCRVVATDRADRNRQSLEALLKSVGMLLAEYRGRHQYRNLTIG